MILAVEGPDRSGKSTLYWELRRRFAGPTYIEPVSLVGDELLQLQAVERVALALWNSLYREDTVYVSDRCLFVTNQVYARMFGRSTGDFSAWNDRVHVLFLRCSETTLLSRGCPDARQQLEAYAEVLKSFRVTEVDAERGSEEVFADVVQLLRRYA